MLARAAKAIASKVQVPDAMAAQSVLAAASLAACSLADVILPFGQARPLSLYLVTVAASGDRKTTADNEALWPIQKHQANLREKYEAELDDWKADHGAWLGEKKKIEGDKSRDRESRQIALTQLGREPEKPLTPFLLTADPTVEGLTKNWKTNRAALGVFTSEGGIFTAGHSLNGNNRIKSAAALSALWNGEVITRVRASEEVSILAGRRLVLHLMLQPDVAGAFLASRALRDQGLLSRILVAAPESPAGTRFYQETASAEDDAAINAYGVRLLTLLKTSATMADGKRNELSPPALPLSVSAKKLWCEFFDHVEGQCGPEGGLAPRKDFAAKAAEHAARIAGILTVVADRGAKEIGLRALIYAAILVDWYLSETCRLHESGKFDPKLQVAAELLAWLQAEPQQKATFNKILQFGPGATRTKAEAEEALKILSDHHWVVEVLARPRTILALKPELDR